jgi:hypothetical protein
MAASITVTKVDNHNFNLEFSHEITGPSGAAEGGEIPLEWIRAVLDYYIANQDEGGSVSEEKLKKIRPYW